jgi:hypothetical protein
MGWDCIVDVGGSMTLAFDNIEEAEDPTCYCGGKLHDGEKLCDKCRYLNSVFRPAPREFESKRDVALRAIGERRERKMMRIE